MRNAYSRAHSIYALRARVSLDARIERVTRGCAADSVPGDREYGIHDKRVSGITRVRNINVDILISILVILSVQRLHDGQLRDHRIN